MSEQGHFVRTGAPSALSPTPAPRPLDFSDLERVGPPTASAAAAREPVPDPLLDGWFRDAAGRLRRADSDG